MSSQEKCSSPHTSDLAAFDWLTALFFKNLKIFTVLLLSSFFFFPHSHCLTSWYFAVNSSSNHIIKFVGCAWGIAFGPLLFYVLSLCDITWNHGFKDHNLHVNDSYGSISISSLLKPQTHPEYPHLDV